MRTTDGTATADPRSFHHAARKYGHRWDFEILSELQDQPMRFTDLMRSIEPTPHPKSLRDTLRRLEDQGLIAHPEVGEGARYEITLAGRDLASVVAEFAANLQRWSLIYSEPGTFDCSDVAPDGASVNEPPSP